MDGMISEGLGHGAAMAGPAMALVPLESATHRAVRSGDWTDPQTWEGGAVPGEGAHVVVPEGLRVTVDEGLAPALKTLRVDGALAFATDRNTELKVDTLVTSTTGRLEIGTAAAPIEAGVTAKLTFADDGPIDAVWDPALISRGALLHGETEIYGAARTGFMALETHPRAGDETLELAEAPLGWQVGDTLVVAGTDSADPESDETVTITAIDGATVSLDRPLARDHTAPDAALEVHVANLTRNVVVSSENAEAGHRGHVMFMHTNDADVNFVRFDDLGRSDKGAGLNDWELVSGSEESVGEVEVASLGGDIVRGRYSVHFHRGGAEGEPATVNGSVVTDDPSWGFVNHSSNVDFTDNVTHNVTGAAYVTEAGDEVGAFRDNIALRTVNPEAAPNPAYREADPGQAPDARVDTQDFGWQGDGFWLHGSGVSVDGNVVAGASGHAYIYWQLGLVERNGGERLVDVAHLEDGALIGPDGTLVRTKHVPVPSFDGNQGYAVPKGLQIHYLHTDDRDEGDRILVEEGLLPPVPQTYEDGLQSTFSNSAFWNVSLSGVDAPYSSRLTFDGLTLLGTGTEGSVGLRLDHFANTNNFTVHAVEIAGFDLGIGAPRQGVGVIDGATLDNDVDIRIALPDSAPRDLSLSDIVFEGFDPEADAERVAVMLDPVFDSNVDFGPIADEDGECEDGYGEEALRIGFLGDSNTEGVGAGSYVDLLADAFEDGAEIGNFGVGGAGVSAQAEISIRDTEAYADLLDADPDIVFVMFGGNDIAGGATPDDFEAGLRAVVGGLRDLPSAPDVILAAPPPFSAYDAEADARFRADYVPVIEGLAEEEGLLYLDVYAAVPDYPENYPDLVHPDEAGNESLAAIVAPAIEAAIEDRTEGAVEAGEEAGAEPEDDGAESDGAEDDEAERDDADDLDDDDRDPEDEAAALADGPTSPPLIPDRIVFADAEDGEIGLYFDQQAPDFVPVPEGSEQADRFIPDFVGLTNAELQAAFGVSFGGALAPDDASPLPGLENAMAGTPLDPLDLSGARQAGGEEDETPEDGEDDRADAPEEGPNADEAPGDREDDAPGDAEADGERDGEESPDRGPAEGEDDPNGADEDRDPNRDYGTGDPDDATAGGDGDGDGDDETAGGSGDDVLVTGDAPDSLAAGIGADIVKSGGGDDTISLGDGDDIALTGDGDDRVDAGAGDDIVKSSTGDDLVDAGDGDDIVLSGDGADTVFGGDGDDVIKPGRGADVVYAGACDDIVLGFRGGETLSGGAGDDVLHGNLGDDVLSGGAGDDRMHGGPGRDRFVFEEIDWGADRILGFRVGSDLLDFSAVEEIAGLSDLQIRAVGPHTVIDAVGAEASIVLGGVSDLIGTEADVFVF